VSTAVPIETTSTPSNATLVEPPKPKLPAVPVVREDPTPKKVKKQKLKGIASSGAASGSTASSAAPVVPVTPPPAAIAPPAAQKQADQATETAPAAPAPTATAESIGTFTVGGDQSPRNRQEAASLISANERRLSAVGGDHGHVDSALLSKVRNFQKDAEQALNSGDAEGAKTLATKGKLLLDDMDRGVPSQ